MLISQCGNLYFSACFLGFGVLWQCERLTCHNIVNCHCKIDTLRNSQIELRMGYCAMSCSLWNEAHGYHKMDIMLKIMFLWNLLNVANHWRCSFWFIKWNDWSKKNVIFLYHFGKNGIHRSVCWWSVTLGSSFLPLIKKIDSLRECWYCAARDYLYLYLI